MEAEKQRLTNEIINELNLQAPRVLNPLNHEVDYIWDMKVSSNVEHIHGDHLEVPLNVRVTVEFAVKRGSGASNSSKINQHTWGVGPQRLKNDF